MTSHVVPPVPRWLGTPVERAFGTVARLRGARGLHPQGVAFEGQAEVHPAGVVLAPTGDAEVVVRLSRGIGVPHPAPDFNGVAVRFVDAHGSGRHQDVLLTTSFSPAGAAACDLPVAHVLGPRVLVGPDLRHR